MANITHLKSLLATGQLPDGDDFAALIDQIGFIPVADVATLLADSNGYGTGAAQFTAGTYIRTQAEGFVYKVAASGASDHHLTKGGSVKLYIMPGQNRVTPYHFGYSAGAPLSARTAILQAWAASGFKLKLPAGTWTLDDDIAITANLDLEGELGARIVGDTGGTFENAIFRVDGTQSALPDLSGDVAKGQQAITFASAHGLAVGDYFAIHDPTDSSYQASKADYRAGEACRVLEVTSSTAVVIDHGLHQAYVAATVDCYKWTVREVKIKDVEFQAPGVDLDYIMALRLDMCKPELTRVKCFNGGATNLFIGRCVDGFLDHCTSIIDVKNTGSNTEYALAFHGSQNIKVIGGKFHSPRHAVTSISTVIGAGGIVSRYIDVIGATLSSTYNYAADFHGNTGFSGFTRCKIFGGANIRGGDMHVIGCTIEVTEYQYDQGIRAGINMDELHNFNHRIEGNHIRSEINFNGTTANPSIWRAAISAYGASSMNTTMLGGTLRILNNSLDCPNTTRAIRLRNQGATGTFRVIVDGLDLGASAQTSAGMITIEKLSGDDFAFVSLKNITDPANNGATVSATTKIVTDPQSGIRSTTISSGASRVSSGNVTFPKRFPTAPIVTATIQGEVESNGSGTVALTVGVYDVTATTFAYRFATASGATVGADTTRNIAWVARLD